MTGHRDMHDDLLIQHPAAETGDDAELLLLFHGVGANAEDLRPLGEWLAAQRPRAGIVSVRAPEPSDFSDGWQWFSVQGVSEANRPARVASAMPAFLARVRDWQRQMGAGAPRTTLIGFSQGAIMALESTQQPGPPIAGRVVAIAGRFAQPPRQMPAGTRVHLLHGDQDPVMPVALAVDAEQRLRALGSDVTLDRFAGLGHGIDGRVAERVASHLG